MITEHANFDQKASGIIMLINKTKSIVFIFFLMIVCHSFIFWVLVHGKMLYFVFISCNNMKAV